jgi:hypothetical protein
VLVDMSQPIIIRRPSDLRPIDSLDTVICSANHDVVLTELPRTRPHGSPIRHAPETQMIRSSADSPFAAGPDDGAQAVLIGAEKGSAAMHLLAPARIRGIER